MICTSGSDNSTLGVVVGFVVAVQAVAQKQIEISNRFIG
jgi:hypothetical protein